MPLMGFVTSCANRRSNSVVPIRWLPGAAAALLYYSGHGLQIEGANYLLPIDIEISSERSVRYGALDIAEIVRDMEEDADVSLVVLDACRDNPFLKQLAKSAGGTRSVAASRGRGFYRDTSRRRV